MEPGVAAVVEGTMLSWVATTVTVLLEVMELLEVSVTVRTCEPVVPKYVVYAPAPLVNVRLVEVGKTAVVSLQLNLNVPL